MRVTSGLICFWWFIGLVLATIDEGNGLSKSAQCDDFCSRHAGSEAQFDESASTCTCTLRDPLPEGIERKSVLRIESRSARETEEATQRTPLLFRLRTRFLKPNSTDPLVGGILDNMDNHLLPTEPKVQPALTRALLKNVRSKLDALIEKTEKDGFDNRRAAQDVESMRNLLRQVSHVNVNNKPLFSGLNLHGINSINPFKKTVLGKSATESEVKTESRMKDDDGKQSKIKNDDVNIPRKIKNDEIKISSRMNNDEVDMESRMKMESKTKTNAASTMQDVTHNQKTEDEMKTTAGMEGEVKAGTKIQDESKDDVKQKIITQPKELMDSDDDDNEN